MTARCLMMRGTTGSCGRCAVNKRVRDPKVCLPYTVGCSKNSHVSIRDSWLRQNNILCLFLHNIFVLIKRKRDFTLKYYNNYYWVCLFSSLMMRRMSNQVTNHTSSTTHNHIITHNHICLLHWRSNTYYCVFVVYYVFYGTSCRLPAAACSSTTSI